MDLRSEILGLLRNRREGFSLPQPFYVDPDVFRIDLETIWMREWLFVGHDCELREPGSFFTVQIGDTPIVLLRDLKGEIRAFHNVCRHRGSRVCATERGSAVRLVCPYHQWSYNLDGRLLFARQMPEDFDKRAYGLKPVACESAEGYLFVCLDPEPPDFAAFRRDMTPYFAPHRLGKFEGRPREHDRREGELEARLGEQPRVLPLLGEPPRFASSSRRRRPPRASREPIALPKCWRTGRAARRRACRPGTGSTRPVSSASRERLSSAKRRVIR